MRTNQAPPPVNLIGGAGFIGTRLCARLAGRQAISILDTRESEDFPHLCKRVDVRDADALTRAVEEGAVIVNLAAVHRDDVFPRSLYDAVNVEGARNCCAAARAKNVRTIVFTSSVAVYGFTKPGTGEDGAIAPFNEYGRSKYEAEQVYRAWQQEAPGKRTLVIIRPTVVFGERNRGNVYNLLRQIASGRFAMVGQGRNRKSLAYVENVAAFIEHRMDAIAGVHVHNYIDSPDFTMNELVSLARRHLGQDPRIRLRIPYGIAMVIAGSLDVVARLTGKSFPVSSMRIQKFCADSTYSSNVAATGFLPPIPVTAAIQSTIRFEFLEDNSERSIFETE